MYLTICLSFLVSLQEDSRELNRRLAEKRAERLVRQLSDENVEARERAAREIERVGAAALPTLRKALSSSDGEVLARVRSLVSIIERQEREARHDAEQRTAIFAARPVEDAGLEKLPSVETEGARFYFHVRAYQNGVVLTTKRRALQGVLVDFRLRSVRDDSGKEVITERCARCSPHLVFIPEAKAFKARVGLARCWYSPYRLVFENPKNGDVKRVGDFEIEVAWPRLKITSSRDWPQAVMSDVQRGFEYVPRKKKDVAASLEFEDDKGGFKGRGSDYKPKGWCSCKEGPAAKEALPPAPDNRMREVVVSKPGASDYQLDELEKITMTFYKPIIEKVEVESPVLRLRDK